ncbi:MAG: LptF/LptG family permease [Pirellulales bacterium]
MGIYPRHVVVEVVKVFAVALAAATGLLLVVGVLRTALEHGLGIAQAIPLLPYVLPDAMRFAVPGAILLAVCNVYGRLSAGNEIVALQALGVNPRAVIWPTLALAVAISLGTVFLNDDGVCWGHEQIELHAIASVDDIVYGILRAERSFANDRISINVAAVEGRRLIAPLISLPASESMPACTISAAEAELWTDEEAGDLRLVCRNGEIATVRDGGEHWSARFPDTFEQRIPLEAARHRSRSTAPAWIPLREIPGEIDLREAELSKHLDQLAARVASNLVLGDFEDVLGPRWRLDEQQLSNERGYLYRLRTEPPRRWASGFSCLCFAMIGLPLAIRFRTADFLTTFFLCFLPILVVYYPLLAFGIDAAKRGALPPEVVWTGNLVVACCGAWLIRRATR